MLIDILIAPVEKRDIGGPSTQTFTYDSLYRITTAEGIFRGNDEGSAFEHSKDAKYTITMEYDTIHNIKLKDQKVFKDIHDGSAWKEEKKGTYNFIYDYNADQPHAPSDIGKRHYTYDKNGNQLGYEAPSNVSREMVWDEENRIQAVYDHAIAGTANEVSFSYDDAGERKIKQTHGKVNVYINQFSTATGASDQTKGMMLTKHIFVGNTRVLSKVMPGGFFNGDFRGSIPANGDDVSDGHGGWRLHGKSVHMDNNFVTVIKKAKINKGVSLSSEIWGEVNENEELKLLDKKLFSGIFYKVEFLGKVGFIDKANVVVGEIAPTPFKTDSVLPKVLPEDNFIFYYHPDHLGSTGYMTDRWGRVYEAMQYTPWGETWMEQRRGPDVLPMYQFTGKELDPETNLYYFGARYYDPQTSVWQSADKSLNKYLDGGGKDDQNSDNSVFDSKNLSLYSYAFQNPLVLTDPDGNAVTWNDPGRAYGFGHGGNIVKSKSGQYYNVQFIANYTKFGAQIWLPGGVDMAISINRMDVTEDPITGNPIFKGENGIDYTYIPEANDEDMVDLYNMLSGGEITRLDNDRTTDKGGNIIDNKYMKYSASFANSTTGTELGLNAGGVKTEINLGEGGNALMNRLKNTNGTYLPEKGETVNKIVPQKLQPPPEGNR